MNRISLTAVTAGLLALSLPGSAGNLAEDIFDMYSNSTSPQTVSSLNRNGVTLGGYSARVKMVDQAVVSFKPPSLSASCNGIDAFGGSFSFLNSDKLEQMARAIIQGAPYYAFGLALDSMCPTCGDIMDDLQDMAADMNKFMANACENAGQFLFDKSKGVLPKEASGSDKGLLSGLKQASGAGADFFDSWNDSSTNQAEAAADAGVDKQINVVWYALNQEKYKEQWSSTVEIFDGEFGQEVMMSIIGSMRIINTGETSEDTSGLKVEPLRPLFSFEDLIFGNDSDLQAYNCDEPDLCLDPTPSENSKLEPLLPYFTGLYRQIIVHLQSNTNPMANTELDAVLRASPIPVGSFLADMGGKNADVDATAHFLAVQLVRSMSRSLVSAMYVDIGKTLELTQFEPVKESTRHEYGILLSAFIGDVKTTDKRLQELSDGYLQTARAAAYVRMARGG